MFDVGDKLVQLTLLLHAPNGQGVVELGLPGIGSRRVGDQAAREALHGDKAHALLLAQVHQGDVPVSGQVAEGELQGVVQAGGSGLFRHSQPVVGDADKPDLPLGFGLLHGLVQAGAVPGLRAEGRVVELVHIDVVGLQQAQAGFQVLPKALHRGGRGLCGDEDVLAHVRQGQAHFLFAVGVRAGGVEIGDAGVISLAQQLPGVVSPHPLNGQGAKTVFIHGDTRAAQSDSLHTDTSFPMGDGAAATPGNSPASGTGALDGSHTHGPSPALSIFYSIPPKPHFKSTLSMEKAAPCRDGSLQSFQQVPCWLSWMRARSSSWERGANPVRSAETHTLWELASR